MTTETAPTGVTPTTEQATHQQLTVWGALKANMRDYGLLAALILIMLFFQYFTNGVLFKPVNLTNIILQNSYIIVMALGMLLVIVAGHIDLSVGSVSGFIGALAAMLMVGWRFPPELAFLANPFIAGAICIVVGAAIGAAQGYLIAYYQIPAFIVTLAGMLIFKGLSLAILAGKSVGPFPAEFQLLSAGFIPDIIGPTTLVAASEGVQPLVLHTTTMALAIVGIVVMVIMAIAGRKRRQARGYESEPFALFVAKNVVIAALVLFFCYMLASYRGLPNVLVVMAVLIAVFVFVTKRMTFGRHDLCGPPQFGDAEGRSGSRARRDCGRLHRWRLGAGRRRRGGRRGDRRLHHGRDEQWHVDHGRQYRLAADDQGRGAAGSGVLRPLQQEAHGLIGPIARQ